MKMWYFLGFLISWLATLIMAIILIIVMDKSGVKSEDITLWNTIVILVVLISSAIISALIFGASVI